MTTEKFVRTFQQCEPFDKQRLGYSFDSSSDVLDSFQELEATLLITI
jgi:hypothetical protein